MRLRAAQSDSDAERASERPFETAGKSLRGMIEAELQRVLIKHLRLREAAEVTGIRSIEEERAELRGQIKAYSHSLLIVLEPYNRGSEKRRKELVSEHMAKAKHMHRYMKERSGK